MGEAESGMKESAYLTRLIVNWFNSHGHVAHRQNTVGVYDQKRKVYRKNWDRDSVGVGDILICLKGGKWAEIEVKIGADRQSYAQKKREIRVKAAGGVYAIVADWRDFLTLSTGMKW